MMENENPSERQLAGAVEDTMLDHNTLKNVKDHEIWPNHVQILKDRAITVEYAEKIGIRSGIMTAETRTDRLLRFSGHGQAYPGLPNFPGATFLAQPYQDCVDGKARMRLRMDQKTITLHEEEVAGSRSHTGKVVDLARYYAQAGVPVVPWISPEALQADQDVSVPLFIGEAPLKAASLSCNGFPALGLGGVMAGAVDKTVRKTWQEIVASKEMMRINWRGRKVYIVFDAYIDRNPAVALGAAWIWRALSKLHAEVYLVTIPPFEPAQSDPESGVFWSESDQGVDDYISRSGVDAFRERVDAAVPLDPETAVRFLSQDENARKEMIQSLVFSACLHVAAKEKDTAIITDVVKALPRGSYGKRDITNLAKRFEDRLTRQDEAAPKEEKGLVETLKEMRYYRGPTNLPYTTIEGQAVPVGSAKFFQFVAHKVLMSTGEACSPDLVKNTSQAVIGLVDNLGWAAVPIRYAYDPQDGSIWVDLMNKKFAHVTPNKVEVKDESTIVFCRPDGMLPMSIPEIPKDDNECQEYWDLFWDYQQLGPEEEATKAAIYAWMMSAARPEIASVGVPDSVFTRYTVGIVTSEHGAGKSTRQDAIRTIIDPNRQVNTKVHEKLDDLTIFAEHMHVISFDNVSYIDGDTSDHLCRLATGAGSSKRSLYYDRSLVTFSAAKPVIMNGITDIVSRNDLLDRSVLIRLPKVHTRRTDREVAEQFASIRAKVLGALLYCVSRALRDATDTDVGTDIRMLESAKWAASAEHLAGLQEGAVVRCYQATNEHAAATAAEDPVIAAMLEVIPEGDELVGTASSILKALTDHLSGKDVKGRLPDKWPGTAKAFRSYIDRHKSVIEKLGYTITITPGQYVAGKSNVTKIVVTRSGSLDPETLVEDVLDDWQNGEHNGA